MGRKPLVHGQVVSDFRQAVLCGQWQPGQCLSPQRDLARQHDVSLLTIRRVVAQLRREGFLETRDRSGTFVAAKQPPPLYGMLLPHDPADLQHLWSRFYATLVNQSTSVARARHCQILPFYALDLGPRAPEYARLVELLDSHRLAGLIFASHPGHLMDTPLLKRAGIPRVALTDDPRFCPVVSFRSGFYDRALGWLAEQGCRRVAVLIQHDELAKHDLTGLAAAHGLVVRPEWLLPMTPHLCEAAAAYTRLLLTAAAAQRVDGLVIGDDNYVEAALAGLRAGGAELGRDIRVLAHANFPWAGQRPVGVQQLGYDTAEVLHACLDLLAAQRAGKEVPRVTELPARFENEVNEAQPPTRAPVTARVTTGEST